MYTSCSAQGRKYEGFMNNLVQQCCEYALSDLPTGMNQRQKKNHDKKRSSSLKLLKFMIYGK